MGQVGTSGRNTHYQEEHLDAEKFAPGGRVDGTGPNLVSGIQFCCIWFLCLLLFLSFSSSGCDPKRCPCQEPGAVPCDKAPPCEPCGEQDLGHKVGKRWPCCCQPYDQCLSITPTPTCLQTRPGEQACAKLFHSQAA